MKLVSVRKYLRSNWISWKLHPKLALIINSSVFRGNFRIIDALFTATDKEVNEREQAAASPQFRAILRMWKTIATDDDLLTGCPFCLWWHCYLLVYWYVRKISYNPVIAVYTLLTLSIRSAEWLLVGAGQNRFRFISAERETAWPAAKTHWQF